ncbi:hypothetical protein GUITHDRAFT_82124 [Guillardia theta CCMP2712]|uniref:Methyltransferase domain-containing protein n=1 Tax=Guillardia theta (strain CCMP2712) TaxID=905079 RepID=L1I9X9_GUITC|nr:hypothetical protein GUITHDRAFT_82124 [Guillardia theta CCMP2712]EKX32655.1 hypothetical protein GUITHDRAFT_82124 [Guillardia theta CCMP2712]|eukprot:XP_005819635.1 hypothetical protein GUITHDRAFT_82124 [Guillardia theta CCMP2712]
MHPDQAAQVRSDIFCYHVRQTCQAIIEFALANNKPFACIPCCLYSNQPQFRSRRLGDGRQVRDYESLVEFLSSMAEDIRVETLPFEGKNKVIYRMRT